MNILQSSPGVCAEGGGGSPWCVTSFARSCPSKTTILRSLGDVAGVVVGEERGRRRVASVGGDDPLEAVGEEGRVGDAGAEDLEASPVLDDEADHGVGVGALGGVGGGFADDLVDVGELDGPARPFGIVLFRSPGEFAVVDAETSGDALAPAVLVDRPALASQCVVEPRIEFVALQDSDLGAFDGHVVRGGAEVAHGVVPEAVVGVEIFVAVDAAAAGVARDSAQVCRHPR
mmetsp:Transcript_1023/g.2591  ORF Transcript_1023/g.2591 Transcript_1023/m.2591 type:complete len:231 (+) Transcript_1023:337-1029(+)